MSLEEAREVFEDQRKNVTKSLADIDWNTCIVKLNSMKESMKEQHTKLEDEMKKIESMIQKAIDARDHLKEIRSFFEEENEE